MKVCSVGAVLSALSGCNGLERSLRGPSHHMKVIDAVYQHSGEKSAVTKKTWQRDCGRLVPVFSRGGHAELLQEENPGSGMTPEELVPYVKVLKDGYQHVDCVKDAMYEHGDKFGTNKFQYTLEDVANSSIVHYTDIVPKVDRKKMTPEVCFEFCRGLDDMGFFGISNGRDCYCTSYFQRMAGDSSMCDSVCEGDHKQMCGGKTKNSIWSMHLCDTFAEDMEAALQVGADVRAHLNAVCRRSKREAEAANDASTTMQKHFGQLGDASASELLQRAKVYSGEWIHRDDECLAHATTLGEKRAAAERLAQQDLSSYENRKAAEDAMVQLKEQSTECGKEVAEIVAGWSHAQPQARGRLRYLPSILAQYYSIMYFVDKDYSDDTRFPVTCDGDMIDQPVLGARPEDCAAACDDHMDCVGFTAMAQVQPGPRGQMGFVCFLFSKFTSAQYYTGCDGEQEQGLLQLHGSQQNATENAETVNIDTVHQVSGFAALANTKGGCEKKSSHRSTCAQKKTSQACMDARRKTVEVAENYEGAATPDKCYLTPNNLWKHSQLPTYIQCLGECCEDYDPTLIFDEITCTDIVEQFQPCPSQVDAYVPAGTTVAHICPTTCDNCEEPDVFVPPPKMPRIPAEIPMADDTQMETVVVAPKRETVMEKQMQPRQSPQQRREQRRQEQERRRDERQRRRPDVEAPIMAMCRAKFSKFSGIDLTPDVKNSFALKELTEANRCTFK